MHCVSFSVQVIRPRCKDSNNSHRERANRSEYGDRHDRATPTGFLGLPATGAISIESWAYYLQLFSIVANQAEWWEKLLLR